MKPDGTILQEETDEDGKKVWRPFSKLGVRKALLSDLSPVASFIGYNYNTPIDATRFEKEANRILAEVEKEYGWMFETRHTDGRTGKIEYVIWSDVFACPECSDEIIFWKTAVDIPGGKVLSNFSCPACNAKLTKRNLDKKFVSAYDPSLKKPKQFGKQVPVSINYSIGSQRFVKEPDSADLEKINKIESMDLSHWHPADPLTPRQFAHATIIH